MPAPNVPELSEIGENPAKQIRKLHLDARPDVTLVARHGDPVGAVSVAFATDNGPLAAITIATLLEARVGSELRSGIEVRANPTGGYVSAFAPTSEVAGGFVRAVDHALAQPVTGQDSWLHPLANHAAALLSRLDTGGLGGRSTDCSGFFEEAHSPQNLPRLDSTQGIALLNTWRVEARTRVNLAFGALGGPEILDAVEAAVEQLQPWPVGNSRTSPWPRDDVFNSAGAAGSPPHLTVELRVPSATAALEAAHLLESPNARLIAQLAAIGQGWKLDIVAGQSALSGGCLLVELSPSAVADAATDPPPSEVARAARLAVDELRRTTRSINDSSWSLAESILRSTDPRLAAASAAWRSLGSDSDQPPRHAVTWYHRDSREESARELRARFDQIAEQWHQQSIDITIGQEPGQGELWVLLASPCGTSSEHELDAGISGLALNAIVHATPSAEGVALEPWVAADGLGLVAHAPRRRDGETLDALAVRVGDALGRALIGQQQATAFAAARDSTLTRFRAEGNPGLWASIEALSPSHPSWLLPVGSLAILSTADSREAQARLRTILSGPLRIAVLANGERSQAEHIRNNLREWLRPLRSGPRACPAVPAAKKPNFGLTRIKTADTTTEITAHVSVQLPTYDAPLASEARWTTWLLNRRGGWLDRALVTTKLAASADASVYGGPNAAAIVVEIRALPESIHTAVMQVRALFGRLSAGALSRTDFAAAKRHFSQVELIRSLDPRYRLVALWRGQAGLPTVPRLEELRRYHKQVFSTDRVVVVERATEP